MTVKEYNSNHKTEHTNVIFFNTRKQIELIFLIDLLEFGFGSNLTSKASSQNQDYSSLIYFILVLSLADIKLGFFPITLANNGGYNTLVT